MAFGGEDDWRGKRKLTEPCDKPMPHHGHGRIAANNSSAAARGDVRDRGRREQLIQEEEDLERVGHTIPPSACPANPPHLEEYGGDYITDYSEEVFMRHPIDFRAHPVTNYGGKQKMVEEARERSHLRSLKI